jgi:hypothetical protein
MVRLITHNLLACHAKGCTSNNFPLAFKDVEIEVREADFNPEFIKNFMPKIEWKALVTAAKQVRKLVMIWQFFCQGQRKDKFKSFFSATQVLYGQQSALFIYLSCFQNGSISCKANIYVFGPS